MPFMCDIRLEPEQLAHGPLTFDGWIDEPWQCYMPGGTAFARGHDEHGQCILELSGPGVLTERGQLKIGKVVVAGKLIARYQTDGEDIPYGRSACQIVYATP